MDQRKDVISHKNEREGECFQEPWDLSPQFPEGEDLLYPDEKGFELEAEFFDDEKQEDFLWQARTGLNFESLCGAIETIIFMSDRPLPLSKIKELIDKDMPLRVIHQSLIRLQEEYEKNHHGLRLVEVAEGYQYRTKATYAKYVQDLFKVSALVLSPTALEVLAIIAYKQPVAKTEIDKIRGVDSGHIVRGLMDKRLVKVVGRSDQVGRSVVYGTTSEFLEVFNLSHIGDLPPEHELETLIENGGGKVSDIRTIVHDGDKSHFIFDDVEELDELANSIKEISSDTDFTSALKAEEKRKVKEGALPPSESGSETFLAEDKEVASPPLSAFDILENYILKQQIVSSNNESLNSESIATSADPLIISDLTAGPFNTPDIEEEDFQMIDLDTGLPLSSSSSRGESLSLGSFSEKGEDSDLDGELSLEENSGVDMRERELETLAREISERAHKLDMDLDFLNEEGGV